MDDQEMRVDPLKLRQLREERSWSQERLADAAGLSLRTVQRVEREGNASAETRLALAGAFGVDVGVLSETLVPSSAVSLPQPGREVEAQERRRKFFSHLSVYLIMVVFFLVIDLKDHQGLRWAYWPILGWGIGILAHARKTFPPRLD
jgi:transcriptional regulator with XRE-family HTH domain